MATFDDIEKLRRKYPTRITRGRAIKLYCKELCCCGDNESWKNCPITACFLWRFRLGKELLGNQTSFKKIAGNRGVLKQKTLSEDGMGVEG